MLIRLASSSSVCLKDVQKHENLSSVQSGSSPRFQLAERHWEVEEFEPVESLSMQGGDLFT